MRIKNWSDYQHYDPSKRAAPPWIRLYRRVLDDQEWADLDGYSAKTLIMLWLLAAESNGRLPLNSSKIAFRLRISEDSFLKHLQNLLHWVECPASALLAECYQVATPEQYRVEQSSSEGEGARAKDARKKFLDFVFLTNDDHEKLKQTLNGNLDVYIQRLNDYIGKTGRQYKSHYFTILSWYRKDVEAGKVETESKPTPIIKCSKCGIRAAYQNGICAPCMEVRV